MIRLETLLEKLRAYSPESDLELVRRAYLFSAQEHKGRGWAPRLGHPTRPISYAVKGHSALHRRYLQHGARGDRLMTTVLDVSRSDLSSDA